MRSIIYYSFVVNKRTIYTGSSTSTKYLKWQSHMTVRFDLTIKDKSIFAI